MTTKALVLSKRKEIQNIGAKYGAYDISLFGSVGKNEDDDDSDIDFIVELEKGRTLFDLGGLIMDLQELLDRKVDVVTRSGLKPSIRSEIKNSEVPI